LALVPSALRIGAERPLHGDSLRGVAIDEFRRDDLSRRNTVLDPMRERGENIVLGVRGWRLQAAVSGGVEPVRARAETAVAHAGNHEQPRERLRLRLAAELAHQAVVELDGLLNRNDR